MGQSVDSTDFYSPNSKWQDLKAYHDKLKSIELTSFFIGDKEEIMNRVRSLCISIPIDGSNFIKIDLSKSYLTQESVELYRNLADSVGLSEKIQTLKDGGRLNVTEGRDVIHTVLRESEITSQLHLHSPLGLSRKQEIIFHSLKKMKSLCDKLSSSVLKTCLNKKFRYIVNIGIGGSDLGPSMVYEALSDFPSTLGSENISVHFLSNVDGNALDDLSKKIEFTDALFIVASKSFTTIETLTNVKSIQKILIKRISDNQSTQVESNKNEFAINEAMRRHFITVSCNAAEVQKFGFSTSTDAFLEFDEGVGGRYSLWGPVGVSIALKYGFRSFLSLLAGAHQVDAHFYTANAQMNAPFLMACAEITHTNFYGWHSRAVIPYNERLSKFASYLQQLEMESNGKSVNVDGTKIVQHSTCPIVYGGCGTNVQHAFFQLLHQGSEISPVDFIIALRKGNDLCDEHQDWLVANCFAQSQALLLGDLKLMTAASSVSENKDHTSKPLSRTFQGNRPSTMIVMEKLTPSSLGALIALYEHKVFVQSILWEINAFDQWGVELGKSIARSIYSEITESRDEGEGHDTSTEALIKTYCCHRN
uniref:Glucose-6-phosphate isomerase n=1 Tax=Perkinsela sp. SMB-60 TaxID=1840652 RepID=A0A167HD38_9EUGL|nr:glucose-6-phosphate isomerase [Perkinsela sp. SMB-60]